MTSTAKRTVFVMWLALAMFTTLLHSRIARAQPIERADIPQELAPWIGWALEDSGDQTCTSVDGAPTCVWPGRMSLEATATGASFELDVVTELRAAVALPGSTDLWPQGVKAGAADAIVLDVGGVPNIWLPAGAHHLEGRFAWKTRPASLPVPTDIGKVDLTLDGAPVATRWEAPGKLWLTPDGTGAAPEDPAAKEQERLALEVFRRIEDGVPLIVTTLLDLRVSGAPREVHLGKPVLSGGVLLAVTAQGLPIRMEGDGDMVIGLKPGKHRIELRERHAMPPEELSLEVRPDPWPADEIWALLPKVEQRQLEPSGIPAIDPSRTNAPVEWNTLQMWKAHAPAKLVLKTTRRGNPEPPPNKLKLEREIWLDATRGGFTAVDTIEGTMTRDYRLDFTGPGELGNVVVRNGRDQLISVSGDRSLPGVELRDSNVKLAAEWRSEDPLTTLPAIGWSTEVESAHTIVHLPPGWQLAYATGADEVYGGWGDDWEVLDLAVLIGIALAAARVFKPKWGVVAAGAVALTRWSGPSLRWWILGAIAAAAIVKLATPGGLPARAGRLGIRFAAVGAAWLALQVVARDAHHALWPATTVAEQIEREVAERETETAVDSADNKEGGTGTRAKGEEGSMGAPSGKAGSLRFGVQGPADDGPQGRAAARSADEIVQTGHGTPRWEAGVAATGYKGTVERNRVMRFYLVSPWQVVAVSFIGCALVLAIAWLLLREAFGAGRAPQSPPGAPYRAAASTTAALCLLLLSSTAKAEPPSPEMLADLKARLLRPPACAPTCADVSSMRVEAKGGALTLVIRASAEATSAIVLPSGADAWAPTRIDVDGKRAVALRTQGGSLLVRVGRGTHEIQLEGPVTGTGFSLSLGTRPHRIRTALAGWSLEGLDDDGVPTGDALVFHRTGVTDPPAEDPAGNPAPDAPAERVTIPPWLEVSRTLDLGVTWTITTTIKRVSPVGPPITVRLPILEGEKVVEGGARMEGGKVTVDLGRDAKEVKVVSAVAPRDTVVLEAPRDEPWSETWVVRCSAIWQCRSEGIPPIENRADGALTATFQPWPAEKLTLHLVKPPAAKGLSTTIDQAVLHFEPGEVTTEATLSLDVRTTTGGTQPITLPEGARITELIVNGKSQPSPDAAALRVPLSPGGSTIRVAFKLNGGRGVLFRAPAVDIGGEANNVRVEIGQSRERPALWVGGGSWGPVVLVWPLMLFFAGIGLALSRLPGSPLRAGQWLVLAPGLTQAPPLVGAILVSWIFAVHHRRNRALSSKRGDTSKQLALIALTFVAFMCFAACVYAGISRPDTMLITDVWTPGGRYSGSSADLLWYFDKSAAALAQPWLLSAPTWIWKILMLAWAVGSVFLLWPFMKSAAARFAEGGVFRGPVAVASGAPLVPAPAPAPASPAPARTSEPAPAPTDAAPTEQPSQPAAASAPPPRSGARLEGPIAAPGETAEGADPAPKPDDSDG